jgi:phospholipid/cholesterol/gamma-HCH transport system substrate-binding protein
VKLVDTGGVIVTTQIDNKYKLPQSEICRLNSSFLGDATLEFVPGSGARSSVVIQNGDYLEGTMAGNPLQAAGSVEQAIGSMTAAARQIGSLAESFNQLMINNDEQIHRIVDKTEKALDGFQQALNDVNSVVGDDATRDSLRKAVAGLPTLLSDTREAVAGIRAVVGTADNNLKNLEGLTRPLGERGDHIISQVDESISRLNELLSQFVVFGKALNSRDGSLGKLLNDPAIYQHVNAAVCNIEQITRELRPIIKDVRVFSDKMARHEGGIIREAFIRRSGIK